MKLSLTIVLSTLMLATPALAAIVRDQPHIISKGVGPLLRQAQALIVAKKYKAALVKVNQAEVVKSTPDDAYVIDQFRNAIAAASLSPTEPHCTSAAMGVTRCDGRQVQP